MADKDFVHLSVHSEYALSDSLIRIKPLMEATRHKGMGAVAITDPDNLYALIKTQGAALAAGIKPIFGAEISLMIDEVVERVTVIATSLQSYRKLCDALSTGYLTSRGPDGQPIIEADQLYAADLICVAGARSSSLGRAIQEGHADSPKRLRALSRLFPGSTYIALSRTGAPKEAVHLRNAVQLAKLMTLPVVAVNDVRFLKKSDFESHEIRVKIAHKDNTHISGVTPEQYLKSPQQMWELFSDIPSALLNSVEIAKRATLDVPLGTPHLPSAPVKDGMSESQFLVEQSRLGLQRRLDHLYPGAVDENRAAYDQRLAYEIGIINEMGFAGYFLIVADFIRWAKQQDIPVGPGRGSGAGSLVAYALGITDLDPLEYGLLFERFLNPERVSMPDFDVDFCMDRRDEVINYVARTYGREAVSQIITFGTMAAKMVVRDVARALGHPYIFGDRLSKLIPSDPGTKLSHALEVQPDLLMAYETDQEVREVIDHALTLEGLARQVGKHAGGVLIAPGKLTDFTPLYTDGGSLVSQYDKDDVEAAGLVKFDFLGLRTLTILQEAVNSIRASDPAHELDLLSIDLADEKTFDLINKSETAAVFQLESAGMRKLISGLKPSSFEEIVALVALFRPGPLQAGMVEDYIARKHGRAEVRYPHPKLEPILAPTYGVFVYQEQVMEAARVLAGYSLGEADILRKAMGKKKPEEMEKQRAVFVKGCRAANDIDELESGAIFDLIETFAGYGFNKSHSAGYALLSFQTAYLKAHYPAQFMAAVMSSEMHDTDSLVRTLAECKRMGLKVKLPNINVSQAKFVVDDHGQIIYGLEAIKSTGKQIVSKIVAERHANGSYRSLLDLCTRTNIDSRALKALIKSGSLDDFGSHRAQVMAMHEQVMSAAKQKNKTHTSQSDMFGLSDDIGTATPVPQWPLKTRLKAEMESFGCFVSGHPISSHAQELAPVLTGSYQSMVEGIERNPNSGSETKAVLAGYVAEMLVKPAKRGSYAQVRVDDSTAQFEVMVPAKVFAEFEQTIQKGEIIIFDGVLKVDDYRGGYRLTATGVRTIDQVREQHARRLVIEVDHSQKAESVSTIMRLLEGAPEGPAKVFLKHPGEAGSLTSLDLSITPLVELVDEIEAEFGPVASVTCEAPSLDPAPHKSHNIRPKPSSDQARKRKDRIERLFEVAELSFS